MMSVFRARRIFLSVSVFLVFSAVIFFSLMPLAIHSVRAASGDATPAQPAAAAINLNPATTNPAQYIINIYDFALIAAGAIAFLMVLYAGIQYLTSAGNPSKAKEATGKLTDTALGILLLFGAFILLRTINPNLVNLTLPGLAGVNTAPPVAAAPTGGGSGSGGGGKNTLPTTGGCTSAANCVNLNANGLHCTHSPCEADQTMLNDLDCAAAQTGTSLQSITVTAAYPQTGAHQDPGHANGCAIDIVFSGSAASCAGVANFASALSNCGANPLNEYSLPPFSCAGASQTALQTGNNLHIDSCH